METRCEVAFWPHRSDLDTASFRVRCASIIQALNRLGVSSRLYSPGDSPPPVLILSKRYDADSVAHANALRARAGTRWALDLCDNHFHVPPDAPEKGEFSKRAAHLARAVGAADWVIASSEALQQEIERRCPRVGAVSVIEDAVDDIALPQAGVGKLAFGDAVQIMHQRLFVATRRAARGRRLVWFGNHASPEATGGISALGTLSEVLNGHHAEAPLTLTVISNNREKYLRLREQWRFPSIYQPWSVRVFPALLAVHDVALIPAHPTPFTVCKTNNRVVTAFSLGVAVAAGSIPSYEEFRDTAVLDDWQRGLRALMDDSAERAARIRRALNLIDARYRIDVISRKWAALSRRIGGDSVSVPTTPAERR